MITATYFGEITALNSRAVWYSDEEDDDEDDDDLNNSSSKSIPKTIELTHETFRSKIRINFKRILPELKLTFSTCFISLSSSAEFKNNRLCNNNLDRLPYLGYFDSFGKAFAFPSSPSSVTNNIEDEKHILWLLFDSTHPCISGQEVNYFVENLHEQLRSEFNLNHSSQIIIMSQQFSSERLEYLCNFNDNNTSLKLPFANGNPMLPPTLIRNQFESSFFENCCLNLIPSLVVCLPSDYYFDRTKDWPTIPEQIIEHRNHDNQLEKTLIYT